MDNKNFSIGICLDLSKAFDTIDHNLLLKNLEIYGIRGNVIHWISSHHSDRSQCASVDGVLFQCRKDNLWGSTRFSVRTTIIYIVYK